jgi:hypothetical protein
MAVTGGCDHCQTRTSNSEIEAERSAVECAVPKLDEIVLIYGGKCDSPLCIP